MKQSIIIPAYNEEKRIGKTLQAYCAYFKKNKEIKTTILVVINNTTDNTLAIVKKEKTHHPSMIQYLNLPRGGKGYAVIEGFKWALKQKVDIIGFVDADLATRPEAYNALRTNLGNVEGAIASRYLQGAQVFPKPTFKRRLASRMYNLLIRSLFFFPYTDTQCGAKIFRAEAIRKILPSLVLASWSFDVDLLYQLRAKGYRVYEVPTTWSDQAYSKVSLFKTGAGMALSLLYLRIYHSPLRIACKRISV